MDETKLSKLEEICLDLVNEFRRELRELGQLGPQPYSSVDLRSYTSNLSNKIGCGGFGELYKGYLPDGVPVAVKVLKNNDVKDETFFVEVRILGKASHRHVVEFYGYCFEDNMKALVFEYMENGSLDKILYENHHPSIEWVMLYDIAIDIAKGLRYLHEDMPMQIIHHDIKPGNVLLDKNFSAKIIDFGMARSMNRDVSRVTLSRERGTFGYNAPETWMPNSKVTSRCDVYSFGMMLFEILRKRSNGVEENWFPGIVWNQFESGKLQQLIKDCRIKEKDKEKAIRLSKVALWCVQFTPERRPSMEDVVLMLQDKKLIEDPPYPSFPGWQDSTSQVISEECRVDNERERSDSLERGDHMYLQNIILDQTNALVAVKTAPSVIDAAMGRIAQKIKVLAEGGYDKIFHQTFETDPEEKLQKSYACYISTSAGPLMGILYLSTAKLAFSSDNPLSYKKGDKTEWSFYKVVIPLHRLKAVNPSKSTTNSAEKYIQIISVDNHEFWFIFMRFVNYSDAVKCLEEALQTRNLHSV